MPETPRNKQGKQPAPSRRGPDGRWFAPPPDPEPPDDQGEAGNAHLVTTPDKIPVTAGGLVIRGPSPHPRTLEYSVNHQARKIIVRPDSDYGREIVQRRRSPSVIAETARPLAKGIARQPLTPSENTSRFSRNTHSLRRVMREHAERAEAHAQSAYEQNRAALDLISKSLDNVRSAFAEAKHARDRLNDMLSVSSRSRESTRRHANADAPSVYQAERDAADGLRKVADYRRRIHSQVLGSDERRDLQPSTVSSWRLRSGMYPELPLHLVEGQNASVVLMTDGSTVQNTPSDMSRNRDVHRMEVREWVSHQNQVKPQQPIFERSDSVPRGPPSLVAHADEVLAHHNPVHAPPSAPKRTAGERVSWLDRLNRPSTWEPPPHQRPSTTHRMDTGTPGGSPPYPSSSSTLAVRSACPQRTPQTPRCQEGQNPPLRDGSWVPEYLRTHRSPTFEPVAPGGNMTPAQTPNRRGAAAPTPAPMPIFTAAYTRRRRTVLVDPPSGGHNRPGRRDGIDKIVDMLSVAFIDEAQAAGRANSVPIHKLGIKFTLPEAYEGRPDQTTFENWLSLLLGFFRIHQLDILNEVQDRARLEILGQALKARAQMYFRERHQMFLEQGELWDFREAILDLRDRYLYKSTPLIAARKFETLMQGKRDVRALYDDLTTQAARMIEYPSDYHFRLRFMRALRPEVLEHIIKTHSVSAEQSTLAQIRSACEDYERSYEYGKQLAATQYRLGGNRATSFPPNESAAPAVDGSLPGFPKARDWSVKRGSWGRLSHTLLMPAPETTANALPAPTDGTAALSVPVNPGTPI